MKKALYQSVVLMFAASGAMAATFLWDGPSSGTWSAGTNWVGDVAPDNDGTADIVFTNMATASMNSDLDTAWSVNSVTQAGTAGQAFNVRSMPAALSVGAGGIIGGVDGSPWMFFRPVVKFTTADSYIKNKMFWYNIVDSSYSGGTKVHLSLTDFRAEGLSTTTNVFYYLESGGPSLYGASLNALGSNKLYVTAAVPDVAPVAARSIGWYGSTASNHLYFDTPIELDAASVSPSGTRRLDLIPQRTGTVSLVSHIRGKFTMANGATITNTGGTGWLWLQGGVAGNNPTTKTYYEQDGSALVSAACTDNGWNGDVFVYNGTHVIAAPNAFKTNNSAFFNIGGASGGRTTASNNVLLATSGNNVSGTIRLTAGDSVTNSADLSLRRPEATLGIEGTGSVDFKGKVLIDTFTEANTLKAMNLKLFAGAGGTAIFSGGIGHAFYNAASGVNGLVEVNGGGTVVLTNNASTFTNTMTVKGNTTLILNSGLQASVLTIESGSTLKGAGTVSNDLTVAGFLQTGNSIGTLTVKDDAELQSGSTFEVELSLADNASDLLAVTDVLTLGATSALKLIGGKANMTYTIANYGTLSGAFTSIDTTGLDSGLSLDTSVYKTGINYGDGSGDSISLTVIPEPASVLLMVSGLVAAYKLRRRA
jgi:hypothetical protein